MWQKLGISEIICHNTFRENLKVAFQRLWPLYFVFTCEILNINGRTWQILQITSALREHYYIAFDNDVLRILCALRSSRRFRRMSKQVLWAQDFIIIVCSHRKCLYPCLAVGLASDNKPKSSSSSFVYLKGTHICRKL